MLTICDTNPNKLTFKFQLRYLQTLNSISAGNIHLINELKKEIHLIFTFTRINIHFNKELKKDINLIFTFTNQYLVHKQQSDQQQY